ncbi:L-threonylcarbamoyladenylate synthase [Paraclostridium sordellii]|uniref:L-threonylcarbamoyladenylate synthase n=1 Tax=Paraclostridium sordellii TaxID=1505 RepID=UPI0005E18421|nr:L-threonylcarbamoyladenylate synthase [Paeniclostridium sordellii]CEQ22036.1 translation factor [[Clostridium] sordellii] [Paeniclostridium sordellii]
MDTKILKIIDFDKDYSKIIESASYLKSGEVVAIPTETVYGLAADAFDEKAIKKVFEVKGRPQDNPLLVHIHKLEEVYDICKDIPTEAKRVFEAFWPGSVTLIFNKKDCISDIVTAGMPTVAVRFPKSEIARAIIKESGTLLVAPSANLSGKPSTTSAQHCYNDLNGKIPCILDGGSSSIGLESTIIDMSVNPPILLRPGAVSIEEICSVIPNLIYKKELLSIENSDIPKAPGMKYRHYAPDIPVTLVEGEYIKTSKWISENTNENDVVICFQEFLNNFNNHKYVYSLGSFKMLNIAAQNIFNLLRECDKLVNINHIYIQAPKNEGLGNSIINRLEKASSGNIIHI